MAKNRKTPDMNLPMWFDGQNINEALFCEEFLQERRIIFANGAFFTPDGRVTDDLPLRGEIYDKLKFSREIFLREVTIHNSSRSFLDCVYLLDSYPSMGQVP